MLEIKYVKEIAEQGIVREGDVYRFRNSFVNQTSLMKYIMELGFTMDNYHFEWLKHGFDEIVRKIKFDNYQSLNKLRKDLVELEFDKPRLSLTDEELLQWLSSDIDRIEYLTLAIEHGGRHIDAHDAILNAYCIERGEVYNMSRAILVAKIEMIKQGVVYDV